MGGNEFCLMTSHLESTREHSAERMSQLKTVFQKMQEAPDTTAVLFAGDTNLRDKEVSNRVGSLFVGRLLLWKLSWFVLSKVWTWKYTVENTVVVFIEKEAFTLLREILLHVIQAI